MPMEHLQYYHCYGLIQEPDIIDNVVPKRIEHEYSKTYDIDFSQKFLKKAKADLLEAKKLYEAEGFTNTPILLAYSIEKAVKSIAICFDSINFIDYSEEKAKSRQHSATRVLKDIQQGANDVIEKQIEPDSHIKALIELAYSTILEEQLELKEIFDDKIYWGNVSEISKNKDLPLNQLEKYVKYLEVLNKSFIKDKDNPYSIYSQDRIGDLTLFIKESIITEYGFNRERKRKFNKEFDKRVNSVLFKDYLVRCLNFAHAYMIIGGLAVITEVHAVLRYPEVEGDFDPTEYYQKDTPIIQLFPRIYALANESLNLVEKFIKEDVGIITNPMLFLSIDN